MPGWHAGSAWWLVVRDGDGSLKPLVFGRNDGQMLPVFSCEEEAEIFLRFGGLGSRWRARLTGCGELISVLYGPCARVRRVALDPLPEMVADGTTALVSLDRYRFLDHLVGKTRWWRECVERKTNQTAVR